MRMLGRWSLLAVALLLVACSDDDGAGESSNNANANTNLNTNGNENGNENGNTNGNENGNTNGNTNSTGDCGNGVVEEGEACDGADLAQTSCADLGDYNHGALACDSSCEFDVSPCSQCGDGVLAGEEECDGADLGGQDCASVAGAAEGTLACHAGCAYDTSGCWECGNGVVESSEECDQGLANCDSAGCACATNCTLPGCGNGLVEGYLGETCDEGTANCDVPGCTCSTTCTVPPPPGDACGYPLDGPWFEIDYSSASTATSPAWTFSNTPGWTGADWAPNGSTWPEVWDLYNNISVGWDPVGSILAEVDGGTLQIMLGLAGLTSYTYASVCVEGRSVSATSSVTFDVYNPLNGCGDIATMSHDWLSFHPTGINLGTCLIPNNDFQAVRIEPSGGSNNLGVIRVRVILHDAVY